MNTKSTLYRLLLIGSLLALFVNGKIETIKTFPKNIITAKSDLITTSESLSGTVTDIDGNVYHTVTIGTQVWMVENLKTTKFRNGNPIDNITVNSSWASLTTSAYCWYNNDAANKVTYGALYNWFAVADTSKIAPIGWHVPTDAEWTTLTTYLGGESVAGGKLKETGTSHWQTPNTGATNNSGFTALPSGNRYHKNGNFYGVGNGGTWWSSTVHNETHVWIRYLSNTSAYIGVNYLEKQCVFSVRCVRD